MKTLNINEILEDLETIGFKINPDFLKETGIDAAMVEQVDLLLDAITDKGLKLTLKENLPTKVVKQIALHKPTPSEGRFLKFTKRFLEEEQPPAMRARVVCEVGKLVREVKGKLVLGTMAQAYKNASEAEKFIYLFYSFSKVNLAYFDRMQPFDALNSIAFALLQLIRDKQPMLRSVEVHNALLLDAYPKIAEHVENEVEPDSCFSEDPFDEFEHILRVRLFMHFFSPFGLVQEHGDTMDEVYECRKTDLLDRFLLPLDAIDENKVLDKKSFRAFSERIRKEKLEIDLFHDFCYIYAGCARYPLPPSEMTAGDLVVQKRLIGTATEAQKRFYIDFAEAIVQTLRQFTQLEARGSRKDLQIDFENLVDALYALLPKTTPYNMFRAMQPIILFFFDMLKAVYHMDPASPDFYERCVTCFNEEVAEDIGGVIYLMSELQKKTKKAKRIKVQLEVMTKEAITAYLLAVMSMYVFEMEERI